MTATSPPPPASPPPAPPAPESDPWAVKPGYQTTEFWVTGFSWLIAILVHFGVIPAAKAGQLSAVAAQVAPVIVSAVYMVCRTMVKTATVKASGSGS